MRGWGTRDPIRSHVNSGEFGAESRADIDLPGTARAVSPICLKRVAFGRDDLKEVPVPFADIINFCQRSRQMFAHHVFRFLGIASTDGIKKAGMAIED